MQNIDCDYLVVGSGVAGMVSALKLSQAGTVVLATKRDLAESNSDWAQGGISCVMDEADTLEAHVQDTLATGVGLCNEAAVREIIGQSREAIRELEALGVNFDRKGDSGKYDLGQEAGHQARRILHAGDITGHQVVATLVQRVQENPNIRVMPGFMAIDLVTTGWLRRPGPNHCLGCYFLDTRQGGILAVRATHTVLATGGAGKVYLYTSNPDLATGDGMAMAWRAGVAIKNMEFVQFHPTCLYHSRAKSFLISEAVRGEGARLISASGDAFMARYDSRAELAPRDTVARAIDQEMKISGDLCVYLDITHRGKDFLTRRFPNIYATCLDLGIDMANDPIPVVPAAHYFCGGVEATVTGETSIENLFVCGEISCTGMHGANRLASNSLLEALVCARATAQAIIARKPSDAPYALDIPDWRSGNAVPSDEAVVVEHNWNEVRTCMWDYVGIVRTNKRLERARRRIATIRHEIRQYYLEYLVTSDILELRNIAVVAELVIRSAAMRHESRGLHFSLDYPEPQESSAPKETRIMDRPGDQTFLN